jgi:hypothetical protein
VVNGVVKLGIVRANVEMQQEKIENNEENKMEGMNKQEIEQYIEDFKGI